MAGNRAAGSRALLRRHQLVFGSQPVAERVVREAALERDEVRARGDLVVRRTLRRSRGHEVGGFIAASDWLVLRRVRGALGAAGVTTFAGLAARRRVVGVVSEAGLLAVVRLLICVVLRPPLGRALADGYAGDCVGPSIDCNAYFPTISRGLTSRRRDEPLDDLPARMACRRPGWTAPARPGHLQWSDHWG